MPKQPLIFVTGFGSFSGVDDNPTAAIVKALSAEEQYSHIGFEVLEVSVKCCDEYIVRSLQAVERAAPANCLQNKACNEERNGEEGREAHRDTSEKVEVLFIHLGVDSNATKIKLEQCAYNNMNFRVPDICGFQPASTAIHSTVELDCPSTTYPLEPILERLQSRNATAVENATISTDPGRYLCNYIYYRTLTLCTHPFDSIYDLHHPGVQGNHLAIKSLFVHVPPFSVLGLADQVSIVQTLLQVLQEESS